jgi:hypothetical protein
VQRNLDHTLPLDARALLYALQDVADGEGVIPASVRQHVMSSSVASSTSSSSSSLLNPIRPRFFSSEPYHLSDEAAAHELAQICAVVDRAAECRIEGESEAAWNAKVHDALFQLALRGVAGGRVKSWNT